MSDFDRNLWCLLGLPVDVVSYDDALQQLVDACINHQACFFSTPNLNFIVEAGKSESFRNSVLESDLVLLDGMPAVWVARLLGAPGIEKVSGSNLFESLWLHPVEADRKIRVFLFGGEPGVAERASVRINESSTALECVGHHDPGFIKVEDMCNRETADLINQAQPDFVLVALGAKKGQAWIMSMKPRLDAPVISHLGAVINFAAGNVVRAPAWMQAAGCEWIWRILQEPALWRRYFSDGLGFCKLLLLQVVPYVVWRRVKRRIITQPLPVTVQIERGDTQTTLIIVGVCVHASIAPLREIFAAEAGGENSVRLDLGEVTAIDQAFLGLCLMLHWHLARRGSRLVFSGLNSTVQRIFRWNGVEWLL